MQQMVVQVVVHVELVVQLEQEQPIKVLMVVIE
jgi:hypothetical protein